MSQTDEPSRSDPLRLLFNGFPVAPPACLISSGSHPRAFPSRGGPEAALPSLLPRGALIRRCWGVHVHAWPGSLCTGLPASV